MDKSGKHTIVVVDDHPIVRQGLGQLLDQEMDFRVVGGAGEINEAKEIIARLNPDIALLDLSLGDRSGLELIKDLKGSHPTLKMLAISLHDEAIFAERTIRAGAHGFVMKAEAIDNIVIAVRQVLKGGIFLSAKMRDKLFLKIFSHTNHGYNTPMEALSDREIEVFEMMGSGLKNGDIASRLNISPKTVETYKSHIKKKLSLGNTTELMQHAVAWTLKGKHRLI